VQQGYALGSAYVVPYTFRDMNGDGIIDTSEVQLGSTTAAGPSLPKMESAFSSALALPGRLTLSATVDYRRHFYLLDQQENVRCARVRNCRAAQDPAASLDDQAAAVAEVKAQGIAALGHADDASFAKLRELAVHWRPPIRWPFVGKNAEVTLAGRNLATWTSVRGYDPEVTAGAPYALPREAYGRTPVPREFVLRLDVGAPLP